MKKKIVENALTSGKTTFNIDTELLDVVEDLEADESHQLLIAILDYQRGKNVELSREMYIIFRPFKRAFDLADIAYVEAREKRINAGRKGGKAKSSKAKQSQAMPSNASNANQCQAMPSNAKRTSTSTSISKVPDKDKEIREESTDNNKPREAGMGELLLSPSPVFSISIFEEAGLAYGIPESFWKPLYSKILERSGCDSKGLEISSPVMYLKTAWDASGGTTERSGLSLVNESKTEIDIETELWKIEKDIDKSKALLKAERNKTSREKNTPESKELIRVLKQRIKNQEQTRNELLKKSVA